MESKHFNERFTEYLKDKNIKDQARHTSSGLISPSKLAKPTLEAVLQLLGLQADPPSDQQLRFFLRGQSFEDIVTSAIAFGRPTNKLQVKASYRGGIGYIDQFDGVPHEIKSAGFWTWKSITAESKPKLSHACQGTFYALGTGTEYAWIHYINTDTFVIKSFKITTKEYQPELDRRIDAIHDVLVRGVLPAFEPLETIHNNILYSDYALFFNKGKDEVNRLLKEYYPEQYKLLKSKKLVKQLKG